MRARRRDPRRGAKSIDRATRSRELTPEEQIFSLLSAIGNANVSELLGHGTDPKGGTDAGYADAKGEAAYGDAKGGTHGGHADSKGGTSGDAKADGGFQIDWLYELRTRNPRP